MKSDPHLALRVLTGLLILGLAGCAGPKSTVRPDRPSEDAPATPSSATTKEQTEVTPGATGESKPEALAARAAEVQAELDAGKHGQQCAVVFNVEFAGEYPGPIEARLESKQLGGYQPVPWTTKGPWVAFTGGRFPRILRISARGYHDFTRSFDVVPGTVTVWDDIVLQPVTPETASTITGTVWLEDDADPSGVEVYVSGVDKVRTDEEGRFRLDGVAAGDVTVRARRDGYQPAYKHLDVTKHSQHECSFKLYRKRYAVVRWAYQPEPTRKLSGRLWHGKAILADDDLDRVSFADGFRQVQGKSDFSVRQERDGLILRHFDSSSSRHGSGNIACPGQSFDRLSVAPDADYPDDGRPLTPGAIFAIRCYDGEHYAKLAVLDIVDDAGLAGIQTEPAGLGCLLPDQVNSASGPISLAVIDLDADEALRPVADAVADMCRMTIGGASGLILVDRNSMVHILGEEDFAASMQCDDTRCLVNYGRKLRAQKLMHGRLSRLGDDSLLTLKIVDVSSGAVDSFSTTRIPGGDNAVLEATDAIACDLLHDALVNSD